MPWFGVRSVYLFGQKSNGTNLFEERIVCFEAATIDDALEQAMSESEQYADEGNFELYPEWTASEYEGNARLDACEVWSAVFEARMSLDEFFDARYTRFEHHPEPHLRLVK